MHLPGFARPVVCGVDLGSHAIHVVALTGGRRGWRTVAAGLVPTGPQAAAAVTTLMSRWRFRRPAFVAALPTQAAFIRRRTVPSAPATDLAAVLQGLARDVLPFPPAELHVDHFLVTDDRIAEPESVDVLLVAARRDQVRERLQALSSLGVTPDVLDVDCLALANAYLVNYPERRADSVCLVDVGHRSTTVALVERGSIASTGVIDQGGRQYADAAGDALGDLHHQLAAEIRRFCGDLPQRAGAFRLLMSGGACRSAGMREALADQVKCVVELADPFRRITSPWPGEAEGTRADYMIAVGLALRRPYDREGNR